MVAASTGLGMKKPEKVLKLKIRKINSFLFISTILPHLKPVNKGSPNAQWHWGQSLKIEFTQYRGQKELRGQSLKIA